ncbi:MAG: peptidylprolyl isomerase [Vampirovibrionia bacterium]
MKKSILTLLLFFVVIVSGCNQNNNGAGKELKLNDLSPNTVIMKIDGKKYTKEDFNIAFDKLYVTSPFGIARVDLSNDKNYDISLLFRSKAVNDIIIRHFIEQDAEKKGIKVSDEEVKTTYDRVVEKLGGKEKLLAQLAVVKMDDDDFKKSLKSDLLANKVINDMSKNIKITDVDLKEYYEKNKNTKFNIPETVRVSQIFIDADPRKIKYVYQKENPDATKDQLEQYSEKIMAEKKVLAQKALAEAVANPANFNKIAEKYSTDRYSALNGGDLGYLSRGKMFEPFDKAIFDSKLAQVGQVNKELVQTDIGFHVIKITDHKKSGVINYDSVKDKIRQILLDNKKIDLLTEFIKNKKANSKLEFVYKEFDQTLINEELTKRSTTPAKVATKDIHKPEDASDNKENK